LFERKNFLIILSSPSGAGKTSLARMLLEKDPSIGWSVSHTTRPPRPQEVHGQDYFFVDKKTFEEKVQRQAFLEYAEVFQNHYGTLRESVDATIAQGRDLLFDVDWQGAQNLEKNTQHRCVTIFLLPPSLAELEKRLRGRNQNCEEQLFLRLKQASQEILHWKDYHYVLVNDNLEQTFQKLWAIIVAERSKVVYLESRDAFNHAFHPKTPNAQEIV
jgi:guanylate kinase